MWDVLIIGSGPAGLGASIECAKRGASVLLVDENERPGGQLFKQIHKFFGSREHFAGRRGYQIGEDLLEEALSQGVTFYNNTICQGFDSSGNVLLHRDQKLCCETFKTLVLATGAIEKGLPFKGWTKVGVMTAGCAQTFTNVYGVTVGKEALIIGSGNVGLITAYQMIQAGMKIKGIVEIQEKITGYGVHLNKIKKLGVPLYLGHRITEGIGKNAIEKAVIENIETKDLKEISVDTILLAVGLRTNGRLATMLKCKTIYNDAFGGIVPIHDNFMKTSQSRVFVAGDICGVEEASTALDEGRLAGLSALKALGLSVGIDEIEKIQRRLEALRSGDFGASRRKFKEYLNEEAFFNEKLHY